MDRPFRSARATSHCFRSGGVRKIVFGCFDTFTVLPLMSFVCHIGIRYPDQSASQIAPRQSIGETMGRPPSPDRDRVIVRLPDGMRDEIGAAARSNQRTMTAEIVARLRASFDAEAKLTVGEPTSSVESDLADLKSQVRMLARTVHDINARTEHLLPRRKK